MDTIEPRDIKHGKRAVNMVLVNVVLAVLLAGLFLGGGKWLGFVWIGIALMWAVNLQHHMDYYVRITPELVVRPAAARAPQRVKWSDIRQIDQSSRWQVKQLVSTGKDVKIRRGALDEEDMDYLLRVLETAVNREQD